MACGTSNPKKGPGGCIGVRPTNLDAFCGLGEGIKKCPLGSPVGHTSGVQGTKPLDMVLGSNTCQSLVHLAGSKSEFIFPVSPRLPFVIILFMDRMGRISRHSEGVVEINFSSHRVSSLP